MSAFQELVKSFPKSRDYVRDFFVYGFKTRTDFTNKSPRTYDNERRRLECWLAPYVRKDYAPNGSNISLAIDSNLLDTNPLYRVWKTKSFTDNDIVLHFLILMLLQDGVSRTAEEITDCLLQEYGTLFDIQTVRRKCNRYEKEGFLQKHKRKNQAVYSIENHCAHWIKSREQVLDALAFYQMAGNFGIIANILLDQFDSQNTSFRVKHSFFVHTLEDAILLELLGCIKQRRAVQLTINSSRKAHTITPFCVPLQIFSSTRSGRRFLCAYTLPSNPNKNQRFTCYRLDTVKQVDPLHEVEEYDKLLCKLEQNRPKLWGVSFESAQRRHLDRLSMVVRAKEPQEMYIVKRLEQEGRGGTVVRIAPDMYQYSIEVFDCNEMLPWIRTFIGRIFSFECTAESVERRFLQDLQEMYHMYGMD